MEPIMLFRIQGSGLRQAIARAFSEGFWKLRLDHGEKNHLGRIAVSFYVSKPKVSSLNPKPKILRDPMWDSERRRFDDSEAGSGSLF